MADPLYTIAEPTPNLRIFYTFNGRMLMSSVWTSPLGGFVPAVGDSVSVITGGDRYEIIGRHYDAVTNTIALVLKDA